MVDNKVFWMWFIGICLRLCFWLFGIIFDVMFISKSLFWNFVGF